MKRIFFLIVLLSCVSAAFAQEGGNRIYGNHGYYNQQRRQPLTNNGILYGNGYGYAIEASVVTNLRPDAFVAVFGVNDEASAAAASNTKVNAKLDELVKAVTELGIAKDDIFVDFITQNRVYDFTVEGNQATEHLSGFETKKTIAIRYRNRELFERILRAATRAEIFDLIKVDYVVSDFDNVRKQLFAAAAKVIRDKEKSYASALGVEMLPVGLAHERYDAFYPSDTYERYQAYETGEASISSNTTSSRLIRRKSSTFFYQPFDGSRFDAVINPLGIEPVVQFSLYLRMQYDARRAKDN